jgi:hypothetical protein
MAKSVFSGFERFSTKFEDVEDGASVEAEVTVDVSVADGEAEATEIAETVAESEQVVEAVEEGENTAETLRFYADIARQHGVSPAFLAVVNADDGLSNLSGVVLPSSESLDATGRNQSTAEQVIRACEAAEKSVWERVKEFFKRLWENLKTLGRTILNKFSSWSAACKRAYESIKDITVKNSEAKEKKLHTAQQLNDMAQAFSIVVTDPKNPKLDPETLKKLGLKMEDDNIVTEESDTTKAKDMKTTEDERKQLLTTWTQYIAKMFDSKNKAESYIKQSEMSAKQGIANAEKLAKMTESSADSDEVKKLKDKMDKDKKNIKLTMKIFGVVGKIAGGYVKACAACRAAKA